MSGCRRVLRIFWKGLGSEAQFILRGLHRHLHWSCFYGHHCAGCKMTDDTYALELDALESWERHLMRLDSMREDIPDDLSFSSGVKIAALHSEAINRVAVLRNKLFPQEK